MKPLNPELIHDKMVKKVLVLYVKKYEKLCDVRNMSHHCQQTHHVTRLPYAHFLHLFSFITNLPSYATSRSTHQV